MENIEPLLRFGLSCGIGIILVYGYCTTPNHQIGFCSSVLGCKSLVEQFNKFNNQRSTQISLSEFLRISLCTYNDMNFTICCSALDAFYWQPGATLFRFAPIHNITTASSLSSSTIGTKTALFDFNYTIPTTAISTRTTVIFSSKSVTSAQSKKYYLPHFETDMCGKSNVSQTRIVGGMVTREGSYPWIAALAYCIVPLSFPRFLCAGTLITSRHVITTAHCVTDELQMVRLRAHDLRNFEPSAKDFDIEKSVIHEKYNPTPVSNDIALLKLSIDVTTTNRIRPICLPLQDSLIAGNLEGLNPIISGWGATSFHGPTSNVLREAQITVVALNICAEKYKKQFPNLVMDDRILCAGDDQGKKDSCQGDSGGPLILSWLSTDKAYYYYNLVGIVSYGYECAKADFPGIYTRVVSFIPWIQKYLNF